MNRTTFLTASATLVAASTAAAKAQDVPGGTHFVERNANFDSKTFADVLGRPAQIRQVWEAVAFKPGVWNNVKNAFNGLQFGFGYPAGSIAMAFAGHGPSAVYGYSDYVWQKYSIAKFHGLVDAAGAPVTSNVYVAKHAAVDEAADPDDDKGMYQDTSVEMLQKRGLVILTCHTAVEEQARGIVKKGLAPAGMTAPDVADDILTHLVPGAVVVPSMVAAIAVLQATYHYAYITLS
jgi:intracellular sulfur oxidation DsrE/DsrF family protein